MTVDTTLINAAKLAARITTTKYDSEIQRLLETALLDLGVAGVEVPENSNALVVEAAITYFLMKFGAPENYEELRASYDEQKGQLSTCTGFTAWGVNNG